MIDLYLQKVFSTRACRWYPDSFFRLAKRQIENEPKHQSCLDRVVGKFPLSAATAGRCRLPVINRVLGDPQGDIASLHEGLVVLRPVADSVFGLELGMDSGFHAGILVHQAREWPRSVSSSDSSLGFMHQRLKAALTGLRWQRGKPGNSVVSGRNRLPRRSGRPNRRVRKSARCRGHG
jgi:hypothetical protein